MLANKLIMNSPDPDNTLVAFVSMPSSTPPGFYRMDEVSRGGESCLQNVINLHLSQ